VQLDREVDVVEEDTGEQLWRWDGVTERDLAAGAVEASGAERHSVLRWRRREAEPGAGLAVRPVAELDIGRGVPVLARAVGRAVAAVL
jgi:hypothetical protein